MKQISCIAITLLFGVVLTSPLRSERDFRKDASLKIIKGTYTTIGKYPIDVSFMVENNIWGAGVIINKNWILTSAFNCLWVDPSFITIRVGSNYWTKGGTVFPVSTCIMHSQYQGMWDYDIALVKINGTIKFSNKARAATLPSASAKVNTSYDVSGWGVVTANYTKSIQLQKTSQTVLNSTRCSEFYNVTDASFCAFNKNAGPCVFDFGAPLNKKKTVFGLYQGSTDCTNPQIYPTLYTNVYYFVRWIKETISNNTVANEAY